MGSTFGFAVLAYLKQLKVSPELTDTSACHRLGGRDLSDRAPV
jgi:hypothetical protein